MVVVTYNTNDNPYTPLKYYVKLVMFRIYVMYICVGYVMSQPPPMELLDGGDIDIQLSSTPGTHYEFKVNVAAGKQECLYQKIKPGANLHVAFEVLRGADRNLDFVIFTPNGEVMAKNLWTSHGEQDMPIKRGGTYAFCMDNTFSRFSSKLVYFFLSTSVPEEWKQYSDELQEFDLSVHNFTEHFAVLDKNIVRMKNLQVVGRQHSVKDWYIIKANHTYVQNWSIFTCVVIILTGCIQSYFVKRLFLSNHAAVKATSTTQARA